VSKEWKIKLVSLLTLLGTIGIIAIIPDRITALKNTLTNNKYYQISPEDINVPLVVAIDTLISIIFLFIQVLIGVRLQRRTGLRSPILESLVYKKRIPKISKKWMIIGVLVTLVGTILIIILDSFVFTPLIDIHKDEIPVTKWWQGLLAMFYGGITEELMLRLFIMTLIVWLLARITKKEKEGIPNSFYYIAIFLTALLFGLGHLPSNVQILGEFSLIILIRTLVLNGLLGLWFGYLYWKKGLEYAMIAHMSADFFIHVLFMSIFY